MNTDKKRIGMAADHAGFQMKVFLKDLLEKKGYEVLDFGTYSEDRCDYPDFAHKLGHEINSDKLKMGIAICGSGNGISMTLNKYPNVRAALCWNENLAVLARQHNDANVLSLPARFIDEELAEKIMEAFLYAQFEGGRHEERIRKIPLLLK